MGKGQTEPDAETIKRLAEYFDCTTDYLLGKTDHPPAAPDPCEDAPMAFMGNTSDLDINALEKIIKQAVKEAIEERKKSEEGIAASRCKNP